MLDDDAGRERELAHEQPGRLEVVQVVERELAAVELVDAGEQMGACAPLGVVRGALVRVLAVRQLALLSKSGTATSGKGSRSAKRAAIAAS